MKSNSKENRLLTSIQKIIEERNSDIDFKDEKFNIFSILEMEYKENKTHSAFIAELLNPHGSHSHGNLFLKLFLEELNVEDFEADLSMLTLEKSIGSVQIDDKKPLNSFGGRIDIYLEDAKGQILSIENKINAPEQKLQIVRYVNHNKSKNKVFYLTLTGQSPSKFTKHTLKSGFDFFEITYQEHIINWLENSLSEISSSLLKESIRQYIILLKKLTGKIDKKYMNKLHDTILHNYEATESIIANANQARKTICQDIYDKVFEKLTEKLKTTDDLKVELGNDVYQKHSQIWIKTKNQRNRVLWFVVESFSGEGHFNGRMFIGILNPPPHNSEYKNPPNRTSISQWVINLQHIPKYKGYNINLKNAKTIQELHRDETFKNEFVNHIVNEIEVYIRDEYPNLKKFIETQELPENLDLTKND
jgi:hypothetical protein